MPAAPIPNNEPDRIKELIYYNILDSEREESFDDLTRLAKEICQAPVALISLIDTDRQWFKSCFGLEGRQTPREQSFCAYTILADEPFIVTDARVDDRVKDNTLVLHPPRIVFYAGIPLITKKHYRLGALCVIDFVPRSLTTQQLETLKTLAKQVVILLEFRLYRDQIIQYTRSLEEANLSKSRFIATLSHEIRTPLNGVLGSLQLMESTAMGPLQMEYFRIAQTCGKSILTIINDVLDLSKMEAGRVELLPRPAKLYDLAEEVKTIVSPSLSAKELEMIIDYDQDIPKYLSFDPDRLRQILLNLTANAIKFSPPQKDVTMKFVLAKRSTENATLQCQIIDRGIGITAEEQKRILTPFAQASAQTAKDYGGTGLGLSIANELLKLMDSYLSITSTKGSGSTFSFILTLPLAQEPTPIPIVSQRQNRSLNILIAEDNPVNQMVIRRALLRKGHKITIVGNGQEAFDQHKEQDFDLVILDLEMPVMDGETAARLMRETKPHTILLALSSHVLSDLQDKILTLMDGYLTKPIDFEQLEDTIQELYHRKTSQDSVAYLGN